MEHPGLSRRQVGRLAATTKASGFVDIATYQALARRPDASKLFDAYGLVTLVQYVGRILRTADTKTHIEVHDYLDPGPVFRKMHSKRLTTYKTLGFDTPPRR